LHDAVAHQATADHANLLDGHRSRILSCVVVLEGGASDPAVCSWECVLAGRG
jgi:hypothetical protein